MDPSCHHAGAKKLAYAIERTQSKLNWIQNADRQKGTQKYQHDLNVSEERSVAYNHGIGVQQPEVPAF